MARDGSLTELFTEILRSNTILQVKVTGKSMHPSIQSGDIVSIQTVAINRIRLGDLVLFRDHNNGLVLHRLLRKRIPGLAHHLQSQGDALSYADKPVPHSHLLGRVIRIERSTENNPHTIDLTTKSQKVNNTLSALVLLFGHFMRKIGLSNSSH